MIGRKGRSNGTKGELLLMKKEISIFMILVLAMSLAACGSSKDSENSSHNTEAETSVQTAQIGRAHV